MQRRSGGKKLKRKQKKEEEQTFEKIYMRDAVLALMQSQNN
jgi:hypothetical protein